MDSKNDSNENSHNLYKCPYCPCYFCNQYDLQKHISVYGSSKNLHLDFFKKNHGRLEYGVYDGS